MDENGDLSSGLVFLLRSLSFSWQSAWTGTAFSISDPPEDKPKLIHRTTNDLTEILANYFGSLD